MGGVRNFSRMFRGKPQVHLALCLLFFFFKKDFFKILFFKIYLSVPGLSCSLQDLPLQHVVSSSPTFLQTWARKRAKFSEPETVQKSRDACDLGEMASLMAHLVKNSPAVLETKVWSPGWEDLMEKEMATHSSILAWEIPWTEEPGGLQSLWPQRVRHDLVTKPVPLWPNCLCDGDWEASFVSWAGADKTEAKVDLPPVSAPYSTHPFTSCCHTALLALPREMCGQRCPSYDYL